MPRENYRVGLPRGGRWTEVLNTDAAIYGGSDIGNMGGVEAEAVEWHGQPCSAEVTLPPLSVLWFVPERPAGELPRPPAGDAFWRPSNQMGVLNTDLAKQLEASTLAARMWRLAPRQASTRHRHRAQAELYVLLEGTGRMRIGEDLLTLDPLSAVLVEPDDVRQLFNDTDADQLWLVVGAPEAANTLR